MFHCCCGAGLPKDSLDFLRLMTVDVIKASTVQPGSNGGGQWPLTNTCGFPLITPGKDTYTAFWIRDFSMAAESGLIPAPDLFKHLLLICRGQNGPTERKLLHGLHIPPWAVPDHINYDGRPSFFPGTYSSGEDQGTGACGQAPPADDDFEFIHLAYMYWKSTHDLKTLQLEVEGVSLLERLQNAFARPPIDIASGLVETTEADRSVGFGFCDAEVHTGRLLFASLLRYRAVSELRELTGVLGQNELERNYRKVQRQIRANISTHFADHAAVGGWLRASTGVGRQADVWGTLFALHLRILSGVDAAAARKTVVEAVKAATIALEGGVRHVPRDMDFSPTSAWERSMSAVGSYQNGGYWHTASGWLIEALWRQDRPLALQTFHEMVRHLREQDYRKGPGYGAPWEVFGPNGSARQNPVYMASVALPYGILKLL